jgi:hypothetical protein
VLETLYPSDATGGQIAGTTGANPDIPAEEQAQVKAIMRKFYEYKKVRDQAAKNWISFYKLFRGQQWNTKRPSWKTSEIINLIWQTIQSQVPLQTDARPKFTFLATEPQDVPFAEILDKICDAEWDKYNWMNVVQEVILDGYITGSGISSMNYDPSLLYGMGAPVYVSEEPLFCYPDPECNDINDEKSEGFFKAYPMPTERLKQKYPKRAGQIKSDISSDKMKKDKYELHRAYLTENMSTSLQMPELSYDTETPGDYTTPKTMVFECYLKPKDVEEFAEQNGEEKIYTVKKKYPNGRYICIANGMILHDGELPYEDGLIPFSKYCNYVDPRQFWGISEVEQLASPQIIINKIMSYTIDTLLYTSNPIWLVSNDADIDTDNLSNIPGAVVEHSPGATVRRENGPQLNPGFMQVIDRLFGWFSDLAGQGDFSQGNAEGGVTAASAIEQLIAASRTRIRQRMRNLDCYLKTAGRQWLNRVLEHYTAPRVFRMTNSDGSAYFMKFHIDDVDVEQDGMVVKKKRATVHTYDESGETQVQQLMLSGELDIKVQAGSDLPFEAADKERKALALFDRQIIDEEEVLSQLQYPNKEKILMRLNDRKQLMAQQQAAAQQGA